jgi:hypothetical protein
LLSISPVGGSSDRQKGGECEYKGPAATVQHGDGSLIEYNPKSTQKPLSDDGKQQTQACPSIPLSRLGGPSRNVEPDG